MACSSGSSTRFTPAGLPWRGFAYQSDSYGVPRLLTEVRDEAGSLLEGHAYDARDRGITSVSVDPAGGRDLVTIEYDTPAPGRTRVTHEIDASTRQVSVFTLSYQRGRFLPTRVEGNCLSCGGAGGDDQSFTYGPDNLVTSRTDANGHVTRYEHDARANLTAVTEAAGTPLERTVRYRYDDPAWPRFRTETDEPSAARPGERKLTRQEWLSGEMRLAPAPGKITGTVTGSPDGAPLAGALVTVGGSSELAYTDEAGTFTLTLPAGTWTLTLARPGYQGRTLAPIALAAGATHRLDSTELEAEPATLTGRVIDGTGAGIAGATVSASTTALRAAGPSTVTDASGSFFLSVPPGTWSLAVTHEGFGSRLTAAVDLGPGGVYSFGDLLLQALGTVTGRVHVGYADDLRSTSTFPVPWQGAPNVVYLGSPSPLDAGAIRLDNSTDQPIAVDRVLVDLQRPGPVYDLWGSFAVPPHGSVILTQTQPFNFDTSDAAIVACGATPKPGDPRVPKVSVVIGGQSTSYYDVGHVLGTGGFDSYCRGNESLAWRLIGTTGADAGGDFLLEPALGTGTLESALHLDRHSDRCRRPAAAKRRRDLPRHHRPQPRRDRPNRDRCQRQGDIHVYERLRRLRHVGSHHPQPLGWRVDIQPRRRPLAGAGRSSSCSSAMPRTKAARRPVSRSPGRETRAFSSSAAASLSIPGPSGSTTIPTSRSRSIG